MYRLRMTLDCPENIVLQTQLVENIPKKSQLIHTGFARYGLCLALVGVTGGS